MEQQEEQKQDITIIKFALLVEDYVPCQKIMTYYLDQLGYQVDLVDDSLTAIQKIQTKTYDLIIQDINLHGCISGEKVIRTIREGEFNVETSIIVWSAYVNKNDQEEYIAWGADAALKKECRIEDLKKAIHRCFLKTRYQRKFYYQLQNFKKKLELFLNEAEALKDNKCINQFKFSLHETLLTIKEYQQWLNFHTNIEMK